MSVVPLYISRETPTHLHMHTRTRDLTLHRSHTLLRRETTRLRVVYLSALLTKATQY